MPRSKSPLPLGTESHLFLVGQSKRGFWVARDLEGRSEGIFRDQKEAMRFALYEGGHANAARPSSVRLDVSPIVLKT